MAASGFEGAPAVRTVTLERGSTLQIELQLASGGTLLQGTLVDHGGGPVGGGEILVVTRRFFPAFPGPTFSSLADEQGRFRHKVPEGTYAVLATADGYAMAEVATDAVRPIHVTLTLVPEGLLTGQFFDGDRPVPGAEVSLYDGTDRRFTPA